MTVEKPAIVKWAVSVLFLGIVVACFASVPSGKIDFGAYYVVGQMFEHGDGHMLYDLAAQTRCDAQYLHYFMPFIQPPFVAVLFAWVKPFTVNQAYLIWMIASVGMFVFAVILLQRITGTLEDYGLLLVFLYPPVTICFLQGQIDSIVLLAFAGALWFQQKGSPVIAGLVLSAALVKFHLLMPFALVFLLRRQWRFLAGLALGAVAALSASLAVSGKSFLSYPAFVFLINSLNRTINPRAMPNLRGLMFALTQGYEIPLWLAGLTMLIACMWVAHSWEDDLPSMCRLLMISVVTAYHANPHDLLLFLPALAVALPLIRWRFLPGVVFLLLATPLLCGVVLVFRGFWCVAPLTLLFLFVTSGFHRGMMRIAAAEACATTVAQLPAS